MRGFRRRMRPTCHQPIDSLYLRQRERRIRFLYVECFAHVTDIMLIFGITGLVELGKLLHIDL